MTDVRFLSGTREGESFEEALARTQMQLAWEPFDPRALAFIGRFSQKLLTDPGVRQFPELAALAHWFRAARLRELAQTYQNDSTSVIRRGRGLVLHLAPANVDSVSMYSWLLSLLAGNVNWVRVSQKSSLQLDYVVAILNAVLAEEVGLPLHGRFVLMTYPHTVTVTKVLSQICSARIVWGGDETVATVRAIPLRPTALEICFPDRFSAAAIRADEILKMADEPLRQLAGQFYNDAFWFAQQACSSPRLLSWVGSNKDCQDAQKRFWSAIDSEVTRRATENTPAMNMARLGSTFEMAAHGLVKLPADAGLSGYPLRLLLEGKLGSTVKKLHCGNGLFLEQQLSSLTAMASQLTDKEQTLAVYGFDRKELIELIDVLPMRAIDRIVNIGDALNFDVVWDGLNLIDLFSRRITLPKFI